MGIANPFQSSINSGELSPRMEARVDFDRYQNAAKRLRNLILYPQGGVTRRPGTRYVAEVKDSSKSTVLIPFAYSQDDSYVLEFGDAYARVYRRQGRIEVDDTDAAITNGTFASDITAWDDRSTGNGVIQHDTDEGGRLRLGRDDGSESVSVSLTANSNGWANRTIRLVLPADVIAANSSSIKLRLKAHTTEPLIITKLQIGDQASSGDAYDFASTPTPVTFNDGDSQVTITKNTSVTTDEVPFTHDATKALVIAMHVFNSSSYDGIRVTAGSTPSGYAFYYKTGGDDTATVNATGYTDHTATAGWGVVSQIDFGITLTDEDISWAEQDVAVGASFINNVHVMKFKVAASGDAKVGFQVGSTSTAFDILPDVHLGTGEHSIEFTPGATTFYVQFHNHNSPPQSVYIDNVSLIDDAPMEVVSPYAEADLADLRAFQAADVVYLLHPDYAPRRLERRGHRSWSITEAFFTDGPYLTTNNGHNFDAVQRIKNPLFENGFKDWTDASAGNAYVEHNNAGGFVELDPGTSAGAGTARLRASTVTSIDSINVAHVLIIAAGPVGVKFGISAGSGDYIDTTAQPGWSSFTFTTTASALHVEFDYDEHDQNRAGVGGCLVYDQAAHLLQPTALKGLVTVTAYGDTPFTSADVGRLLRMTWAGREPGYGVITEYVDTDEVVMLVLRDLASTAPTEDWNLGAWGGDQGFPKVIGWFDGRSVFANTPEKPQTLWLSQSASPQNMRPDSFVGGATTVEDDDAIDKTLEAVQIDPVTWLNGQRQLLVGTAGGAWVVESSGAAVTPSDMSAKQQTAVPAADLRHVSVNQVTVFTDRSRREVYDLGFKFEDNSFIATDLTILADHMFRSPVAEMAFQRRPYSIVWCRRDDGRLAALSYNRQHDVLGWSQSIIGGTFGSGDAVVESITTIPGAEDAGQQYDSDERDELWMIVKRTINGGTKRYVEFMEKAFEGPLREDYTTEALWRAAVLSEQKDAFYVDCGLTYDGAAATTISGLDHLEGETVSVLADGKVIADKTVASGAITLSDAAAKVHVGLGYTHSYESLKIAVGASAGTSVNKVKIVTGVGVVLLDCGPFKVTTVDYDENGRRRHTLYDVKIMRAGDDPNAAIPLYTGETGSSTDGAYSGDARLYCEGDAPLPFTLLGLAPEVKTEDRRPSRAA